MELRILIKYEELKLRFHSIFWILRSRYQLLPNNGRFLFIMVFRPIWTYSVTLWGHTAELNLRTLQRQQDMMIRKTVRAPWYISNRTLQEDLQAASLQAPAEIHVTSYKKKLHRHTTTPTHFPSSFSIILNSWIVSPRQLPNWYSSFQLFKNHFLWSSPVNSKLRCNSSGSRIL